MTASEKTKYHFAESIKELMQSHSLDKISVTDIVARSGMTRQTFYRNFKDKYDLVNWYFERLVQKSFKRMGVSYTLKEGLIQKFNFILNEKQFFAQAFQSRDYNSIVNYDYETILRFYSDIISRKTGGALPDDVRFLLEMYCRGSIDMTVQWAASGMKRSPEQMAELLTQALPERLVELLSDLHPDS